MFGEKFSNGMINKKTKAMWELNNILDWLHIFYKFIIVKDVNLYNDLTFQGKVLYLTHFLQLPELDDGSLWWSIYWA